MFNLNYCSWKAHINNEQAKNDLLSKQTNYYKLTLITKIRYILYILNNFAPIILSYK